MAPIIQGVRYHVSGPLFEGTFLYLQLSPLCQSLIIFYGAQLHSSIHMHHKEDSSHNSEFAGPCTEIAEFEVATVTVSCTANSGTNVNSPYFIGSWKLVVWLTNDDCFDNSYLHVKNWQFTLQLHTLKIHIRLCNFELLSAHLTV